MLPIYIFFIRSMIVQPNRKVNTVYDITREIKYKTVCIIPIIFPFSVINSWDIPVLHVNIIYNAQCEIFSFSEFQLFNCFNCFICFQFLLLLRSTAVRYREG